MQAGVSRTKKSGYGNYSGIANARRSGLTAIVRGAAGEKKEDRLTDNHKEEKGITPLGKCSEKN